jgi:hypothetical protein
VPLARLRQDLVHRPPLGDSAGYALLDRPPEVFGVTRRLEVGQDNLTAEVEATRLSWTGLRPTRPRRQILRDSTGARRAVNADEVTPRACESVLENVAECLSSSLPPLKSEKTRGATP